jgi:ABC-type sugar transport system ATPase subunit
MTATHVSPQSADPGRHSVRASQVGKAVGRGQMFAGLDLEIGSEELLILLGSSGCGKTTTLNAIAGVGSGSTGSVHFVSEDVNVPAGSFEMAMVFQSLALHARRDVRDDVTFLPRLRKAPQATIDERLELTSGPFRLSSLLERRIQAVSGGERHRLAIAKAPVKRSFVFLPAEPSSNLGAKIHQQLGDEPTPIQGEVRTMMVFVTHGDEEAVSSGDRAAVMNKGPASPLGSPLDFDRWPRSPKAAKFVGDHPINPPTMRCQGIRMTVERLAPIDFGRAEGPVGSSAALPRGAVAPRPEPIALAEGRGRGGSDPVVRALIRWALASAIPYDAVRSKARS